MRAWLSWLWQWIKYVYAEYKPKPRVGPSKPTKPGSRTPREYVVPKQHTLEILRLFDNLRNAKGSANVEKHLLWKRIQEVLPPLPSGSWNIDASSVTCVIIKESIEKDK